MIKREFKVSEIVSSIKNHVEPYFQDIWVVGEITNFKVHVKSGHCYLYLKDERALLKAIIFKNEAKKILTQIKIEDGLMVSAFGSINIYLKSGDFSLIIKKLIVHEFGELYIRFERLKQKLLEEGLFDKSFKKPIPKYPRTIGVITSISGSALRDILRIVHRRYSPADIIIIPTLVQGDEAAYDIADSIRFANKVGGFDVLIVGRGGGSINDLWCFNEEVVARAIFESNVPIISAVGHQTDFTISDMVADIRAATPSEAAEKVVRDQEDILREIEEKKARLKNIIRHKINIAKEKIRQLSTERLVSIMQRNLNDWYRFIDDITNSIISSYTDIVNRYRQKLDILINTLKRLSPEHTLKRGYSITYIEGSNIPLKDTKNVKQGSNIISILYNGKIISNVNKLIKINK